MHLSFFQEEGSPREVDRNAYLHFPLVFFLNANTFREPRLCARTIQGSRLVATFVMVSTRLILVRIAVMVLDERPVVAKRGGAPQDHEANQDKSNGLAHHFTPSDKCKNGNPSLVSLGDLRQVPAPFVPAMSAGAYIYSHSGGFVKL
jgi:hypothetical protein